MLKEVSKELFSKYIENNAFESFNIANDVEVHVNESNSIVAMISDSHNICWISESPMNIKIGDIVQVDWIVEYKDILKTMKMSSIQTIGQVVHIDIRALIVSQTVVEENEKIVFHNKLLIPISLIKSWKVLK